MQLQPFKRPNYASLHATRAFMANNTEDIAATYRRPQDVSYVKPPGDATTIRLVGSNMLLAPGDQLPLGPKVGDLHPWDALVDGCLYYDAECDDSRPYLMRYNGAWIWMCSPDEALIDWRVLMRDDERRPSHAYVSQMALVIATSIDTAEKCRDAIAAHKNGGAK